MWTASILLIPSGGPENKVLTAWRSDTTGWAPLPTWKRGQILIISSISIHLRQRSMLCRGTHVTAQLCKSALQLFVCDLRCCGLQAAEQRLVMLRPLCVIHCLKLHQLLWRPEMANEKLTGIKVPDSREGGKESVQIEGVGIWGNYVVIERLR